MFTAVLILALVYLPGHFLGDRLARKGDGLSELFLLRITASLAISAPTLTLLALSGFFTAPVIAGVFGMFSVAAFRLGREGEKSARATKWDFGALALVLGSFALYARPAEYIVNSRDPGVYTLLAHKLSRTGALLHRDPLVEAVSSFRPFLEERKYPGFFINAENVIVPQFFPGPFAFLGFGDLVGGVWGSLFVVPVMGALSVGMAFMLGKEIFGRWAGAMGAALLTVSFTQIWWSRHPSSEVMAQLFILAGLWLMVRFARRTDPATGVLAGFLLGGAMLLRVDAFLAAVAVPLLFSYDLLTRRDAWRWLYPGIPPALFAGASLVYLNTIGGHYLYVMYSEHGLREVLSFLPYVIGGVVVLAAAFAFVRARWGRRVGDYLEVRGGRFATLGAVCVAALALWAFFVMPVPWESLTPDLRDFDAYRSQVVVRMVWFVTPAVGVLALAGLVLAARRPDAPRALLVGAALGFGLLYAAMPNVAPDLPWATRRFVPAVLPIICLLAGYAIFEAGRWMRSVRSLRAGVALSGGMFAASFLWTLYVSFPMIPFQELDGAVEAFESAERKIPEAEVVYMEMPDGHDMTASTFEYLHGHPVLPYDRVRFIRDTDALEEAGLLDDTVYITTNGEPPPFVSGLRFRELGREEIDLPMLAPTEGHESEFRFEVERLQKDYRIYRIGDER